MKEIDYIPSEDIAVIAVTAPGGIFLDQQLYQLAAIAQENLGFVKLCSGQRLVFVVPSANAEVVKLVLQRNKFMVVAYPHEASSISSCVGGVCGHAKQDSLTDVVRLSPILDQALWKKSKLNIAFSGCEAACEQKEAVDITVIGQTKGYDVYIMGPFSGHKPALLTISKGVHFKLLGTVLNYIMRVFVRQRLVDESLYVMVNRLGTHAFIRELTVESGIGGDSESSLGIDPLNQLSHFFNYNQFTDEFEQEKPDLQFVLDDFSEQEPTLSFKLKEDGSEQAYLSGLNQNNEQIEELKQKLIIKNDIIRALKEELVDGVRASTLPDQERQGYVQEIAGLKSKLASSFASQGGRSMPASEREAQLQAKINAQDQIINSLDGTSSYDAVLLNLKQQIDQQVEQIAALTAQVAPGISPFDVHPPVQLVRVGAEEDPAGDLFTPRPANLSPAQVGQIFHLAFDLMLLLHRIQQAKYLRAAGKQISTRPIQKKVRLFKMAFQDILDEIVDEQVNLSDFLTKVIATFFDHLPAMQAEAIHLEKDFFIEPDIFVGVDQALGCGIIGLELLANAMEHAFKMRVQGRLRFSLARQQQGDFDYVMEVADDGVGIGARDKFQSGVTLGFNVIDFLAKTALLGRIEAQSLGGLAIRIKFKSDMGKRTKRDKAAHEQEKRVG